MGGWLPTNKLYCPFAHSNPMPCLVQTAKRHTQPTTKRGWACAIVLCGAVPSFFDRPHGPFLWKLVLRCLSGGFSLAPMTPFLWKLVLRCLSAGFSLAPMTPFLWKLVLRCLSAGFSLAPMTLFCGNWCFAVYPASLDQNF